MFERPANSRVQRVINTKGIVFIIGASVVVAVASAAIAARSNDEQLSKEAKITRAMAEHIALARVPGGAVKSAEIEPEKGHLVWSFDIARPHQRDITEVLVDAKSGSIISVQTESPADQAPEAAPDRRQRH